MTIAAALALCLLAQGDPVPVTQSWVAQSTAIDSPALQRIVDEAGWRDFWKRHTRSDARPPEVNFRKDMVLVLPSVVAFGDTVLRPPAKDPRGTVTGVEVRRTDEALKVSVTLALTEEGLRKSDGPQTRTLLTLVALPKSLRPVDYAPAGKLEEVPGAMTLQGVLRWSTVEGGAWILHLDQKHYDLHGKVEGAKSGDRVEVYGHVPTATACIHMCGPIFQVETLRLLK